MIHWLIGWLITAAILFVVSRLIRDFEIPSFGVALVAALVLMLVNGTVGAILKFLTLPITIVTLGLFLIVINALMLKLAAAIVPGFKIRGFAPAIWAAILIAIANILLGR
jgi:putative membrane protein